MINIRFIAVARREFLAEVAYDGKIQPALGARFSKAVEEATIRTRTFPKSGSPGPAGTRRMFVKGFPFSVVYQVKNEGIVVFAVAHHARKPGYWHKRVKSR